MAMLQAPLGMVSPSFEGRHYPQSSSLGSKSYGGPAFGYREIHPNAICPERTFAARYAGLYLHESFLSRIPSYACCAEKNLFQAGLA